MIRQFIAQILFLTRIPVPVKIEFDEDDFVKGAVFAPVAGLIIGILLAVIYYYLSRAGLYILAVISVITLEIILTGGLHLDGLADTADGFFSYRPRERIIEIMKDPHVGTNGILALIIIILIKTSLLFSLGKINLPVYLVIMPVLSRMNIVWCAGLSRYAGNEKGMAKGMVERTGVRQVIIATVITALIMISVLRPGYAIQAVLLMFITAGFASLFLLYSSKKIGGITGDVIGAVIELTEIIILISLVVFEKNTMLRIMLL
jgi:adenosylcobinamide-GDP ribazoletransferase